MRLALILNRNAGTIRDAGPAETLALVADVLREHGHEVRPLLSAGEGIEAAIRSACEDRGNDAVVVGGGDGTISAAAGIAARSGAVLGVLPAGTVNLFARALRLPLGIRDAAAALAGAKVDRIDVAEADGRFFVHHLSFGLHPKMIRLREKVGYASRWGKIWSNFQALRLAIRKPPVLRGSLSLDGRTIPVETPLLVVTNNLLGEGHLPYADTLTGGVLGVYVARSHEWADLLELSASLALGSVRNNGLLDLHAASAVVIDVRSSRLRLAADGEIVEAAGPVPCRIHPRRLAVLRPDAPGEAVG